MSQPYSRFPPRGGLQHLLSEPGSVQVALNRARGGDVASFVTVLREHDAAMRTIAWRLTGDRFVMDDALLAAYGTAFRTLGMLREDAGFASWLAEICRSVTSQTALARGLSVGADLGGAAAGAAHDLPPHGTGFWEAFERSLAAPAATPAGAADHDIAWAVREGAGMPAPPTPGPGQHTEFIQTVDQPHAPVPPPGAPFLPPAAAGAGVPPADPLTLPADAAQPLGRRTAWEPAAAPVRTRPTWPFVVGGAAVVTAIGVIALVSLVRGLDGAVAADDESTPAPSPEAPSAAASAPVAATTTGAPSAPVAVGDLAARPAAELPAAARDAAPGTVEDEWYEWTDANGTNALVLSVETAPRQGRADGDSGRVIEAEASTLYATLLAGTDGSYRTLRQLTDPGVDPCGEDLSNEFTDGTVQLTDSDGDGIGEITVGWAYACRGDVSPLTVKLALLEGKDKYILRGTGWDFEVPDDADLPPLEEPLFTPEPEAADWPDGAYDSTASLYRERYAPS